LKAPEKCKRPTRLLREGETGLKDHTCSSLAKAGEAQLSNRDKLAGFLSKHDRVGSFLYFDLEVLVIATEC
jgi:hypothetical protein